MGKKKVKTIIISMCDKHTEYTTVYPPKTNCIVCWKLYATRLKQVNMQLRKDIKELKNAKK